MDRDRTIRHAFALLAVWRQENWALARALIVAMIAFSAGSACAQSWPEATYRLPPVAISGGNEDAPISSLLGDQKPLTVVLLTSGECTAIEGDCCDDGFWRSRTSFLDTASVFMGLDGSKQPQDFGINAQFGGRAAVNWGVPLIESLGIGAQIGTAIDATGDAVQVQQRVLGSTGRTQSYTTVGLFQRTDWGFQWGVVYDFLSENYYDRFSLGQWRLNLGYQLTPRDTIGVWSAISEHGDEGHFGAIPVTLVPITQTNAYINHQWNNGVQTAFWGGLANSHGQVNAVLGDLPPIQTPFVFGAQLYVPLTDRLAIFGQGNFITPASSGTVDSYLGFVFYPHGGARHGATSAFSPLQTVAAPTNFAVDLRR